LGFLLALFLQYPANLYGQIGGGLKAEPVSAKLDTARHPSISFRVSDAQGTSLDLKDIDGLKFTIAAIKEETNGATQCQNYILNQVTGGEFVFNGETRKPVLDQTLQPSFDKGGTLTKLKPGLFQYTFKTALPATYDRNATHVIGGELTRANSRHAVNFVFEFVPSGASVKVRRAVVNTQSCNSCHDPLQAHSGVRREVGYCALCHTPQLTDPETGESLDFKVFVHKIHRGKMLPTVRAGQPFLIVGENQRVSDYSRVRYPQALASDGNYKELRNCLACHSAARGDHWKRFPSAAACTSCHNQVDLATGKNHKLGPAADGTCIGCHAPDGPEFGPSIAGAHTYPGNSEQLPGLVFDILKIVDSEPGKNPSATYRIRNKKGEPVDAAKLPNLRLVIAWPTTDYKVSVEEDARKARQIEPGTYFYRFNYAIPVDASGSGAIGLQGFALVDVKKPNGELFKGQRDVGINVVKYFSITDKEPVPRRKAVKIENCNVCHLRLATHGEARNNTEFCVMCHHAAQTDGDKRKAVNGPEPAENVHYKRLIHRIHTGADAGEPFIVYGGTPAKPGPVDFSDVRFPGDRRNCVKCHVPGANEPPLPAGLLPTLVPQSDGSTRAIQPIASACIACHTKPSAAAHTTQ
jgi:OmcA/MtrC family decaheme c-type cytochrome